MGRRVGRHEGERDLVDEARGAAQLVFLLLWLASVFGIVGSSLALWIKLTVCAIAAAVPTALGFRVRRASRRDTDAPAPPPDPVA
jgi:membrane protein implicated in regulation of membrane protease activity